MKMLKNRKLEKMTKEKKENFDEACKQTKLILGSTQIAVIIQDWSVDCTRELFKIIGKDYEYATQEFIDILIRFACFFHYLFNLKLFSELKQNTYKDVNEETIKIFSNAFVKLFYKDTEKSEPEAINKYAKEINSYIHDSISWYAEKVMTPENEERSGFIISASLLSNNISQKLGKQDDKQLDEDVMRIIMKVMDTKKIDESITKLTN